ncbi:MAG: CopG family ribbon-helix-helix protein [Candidatus Sericytochromatia bacterium]
MRKSSQPRGGRKPKPPGEKFKTVTIKLPPGSAERLKLAAKRRGVSQGFLVEQAVAFYIDTNEAD